MYYNLIIWKIFKYPFKSKIDVDLTWFKLLKHDAIKLSKCICGPRILTHAFPTRWQVRFLFQK